MFLRPASPAMDRLSTLLSRFTFNASVFFNGEFCGSNDFSADNQLGQLHLVRRGPVVMHHNDRPSLHIDVPTLVFYPRGLNHRLVVPAGSSASLLCANIAFQGGVQSALAKALPDYLMIPLDELVGLQQTFSLMFEEAASALPGQKLVLDRLFDVGVVQVLRHAFATGKLDQGRLGGFAHAGLCPAMEAMHDDPARAWSLDLLAALCSMSRSKFADLFREVVGSTPMDYLTDLRMSKAQSLLKKHQQVQVVALKVGYASQPAFTKAFTAKFGMSPKIWLNLAQRQ